MLVKLIKKNEVTIGSELINLSDTKNYYIPRTFKLPYIEETIFKDEKSRDLLAISGIDKINLNRLVKNASKICSYEEYMSNLLRIVSIVILDNELADDQVEQLCRRKIQSRNIHWLKFEQGNLIWKRSLDSCSKLHKHIIEEKSYKYPENEFLNQMSQQKVIIISDTSGTGKSTVLTNLALQIKERDPALWVIRININEHTKQLKKMAVSQLSTIEVATHFLANDILKLATPFEQALFKYYCQHSHGKLIVMFDGFDEISSDYRKIVIDLMDLLRKSTIKQLWVTTRPSERDILEDKLQQISYKLEPFSKPNQVNFLTKFWQQTSGLSEVTQEQQERLTDYAEALIGLLAKSIRYKDTEFTGIPLQTRMVAEAFEKDSAELLKAKEAKLQLPEKLDLTDLYERFLKKKCDTQQEKSKLDISQPNVKAHSETEYSKFIEKLQNLALYTLFPEDKVEMLLYENFYQEYSKEYPNLAKLNENNKQLLFEDKKQQLLSFINDIKIGTVTIGIIDQIIEDKPHFIHRTFAEYLVGKFLVASLDNETIFEFVLQEILMQPAYQATRAFLNRQLPESLPENTLARYGKQIERLWQSDQNNFYNKIGMTLLHIAAEEGTIKIIKFFLNSLKGHEKILKSLVDATIKLSDGSHYYSTAQDEYPTALHLAAARGYLDAVQCLVEHGADVNIKSNFGQLALHWAAQNNNWDVVQWLVKHGKVNVEAIDKYGRTVLHWAIQSNLDTLQWLVEYEKVNVEAIDNYGRTALHYAAQLNKWDVVQWLVEHGKVNVQATDKYGRTVLHWAARGNLEVIQWLMELGKVNVQAKNKYGETALHWAARGNLDVVQWLVEHGKANVDAIDQYGQTVLHRAAKEYKWDVVKWLVEHGKSNVDAIGIDGQTVLHWAALGNLDVVQWLVEHGKANVEAIDNDGRTVLHWAALGNLDVVQWLVEHGKVNVEATTSGGSTVLHWAARGNLLVIKWLIELGKVNVEATDKYGRTVLHWAAQENKWGIVQWLVEHGKVNVAATDNDGWTVLHWATRCNLEFFQWLVEHGKVNVEATTSGGSTVLHRAVLSSLEIVQWLVEHGKVNVEATDNNGWTALHHASQVRKTEWNVIPWLVEHGKANVNAIDNDGRTVLHWAARGNLLIVKWLMEHGKVNVEATDNKGQTVLHWATWGNLDVVQWLVEHGKVNVEAKDKNGRTALHCAAQVHKRNIVHWLVKHAKANFEATDNDGRTVLHYAVYGNFSNLLDIVQCLVEHGANLNATDIDGKTPLNLAEEGRHKKIAEYLKKKMVESVEQVSTESATMADVITVNGPEDCC